MDNPAPLPRPAEPAAPAAVACPHVGADLNDNLEVYEVARRSAHRAFFLTGVVSLALLGTARTPTLVLGKIVPGLGAEVSAEGGSLPLASYAVVCGLVVIPLLVCWCFGALTYALGLRETISPLVTNMCGPERERLTEPLLGSAAVRARSGVARWFAGVAIFAAGAIPITCDMMLLVDYSGKFSFGRGLTQFNEPQALWFTSTGPGGTRPESFDGFRSDRHPSLFPWSQPWLYLGMLIGAALLIGSVYRQLGVWDCIQRTLAQIWVAMTRLWSKAIDTFSRLRPKR